MDRDIYATGRQINKYPLIKWFNNIQIFCALLISKLKAELGCGTANNIAFLAKEGFDAMG